MLIAGGKLDRAALADDVVIVTGAGAGIGFEAARSLLYLGARLVIAEIDPTSGRNAEAELAAESGSDRVMIALAERYAGQEISSSQALIDAGIDIAVDQETSRPRGMVGDVKSALELCGRVEQTLVDQSNGWKERSFFERQWMLRDFKQRVGMPVERCLETLAVMQHRLSAGDPTAVGTDRLLLEKLGNFYAHLGELAQGYVKNPQLREEQLKIIGGWHADVQSLSEQIASSTLFPLIS
jgi:hypothetical protein